MSLYEMRNTVAGRVAGTLAAFALVLSLSFGGALNAQAQTTDLEAEIERLMGLIAQLQAQIAGGTTSTPTGLAGYQFARNLTPGSTGDDVMKLQQFLNANGAQVAPAGQAGSAGNETSFYGPATGAAVKAYQEMHRAEILAPLGLTVGTGNFGPSTLAYVNAQLASAPTTPTTPGTPGTGGDLEGEEADLSWTIIGESDIAENSADQHAFTIEISSDRDGGDAEINRLDLVFSSDVTRLYRAISRVTLEVDGDELASVRTDRRSDWRSDDSVRFSGLDLVVRSGETVEIEVLLDVTDEPTSISLDEVAYRFVDAVGLVVTDSEDDGATVTVDDVEGLSFRVTKNRNTPADSSLDVSSNNNNVTLAIADVDVNKGVEGVVEDVQVEVEFDGAADLADVQALVSRFTLELDGRQVDSINTSSLVEADDYNGGVVTLVFDADEFVVEGGDDFEIEVVANFRSYDDATITSVQVVSVALAGFDEAADEEFDFGDTEKDISSWAGEFTLTLGDVDVYVVDVEHLEPASSNSADNPLYKVTFELTNNTENSLNTADGDFDWGDYTGVGGTVTTEVVDGPPTLGEGETAEYVVEVEYTHNASGNFSIVLDEVNGIPVGYTLK